MHKELELGYVLPDKSKYRIKTVDESHKIFRCQSCIYHDAARDLLRVVLAMLGFITIVPEWKVPSLQRTTLGLLHEHSVTNEAAGFCN